MTAPMMPDEAQFRHIRCGACLAGPREQCRSVSTGEPRPRIHRFRILQTASALVPCGRCDAFGWKPVAGVSDEMQVSCGSCGAPAGAGCRGVTELHHLRTRQVELGLAPCSQCGGHGWEPTDGAAYNDHDAKEASDGA